MKKNKFLLVLLLVMPLFVSANARHYQTVTKTANDAVTTTPVKIQGSDLDNHGFAVWEETMTMNVTVYFGLTYTADVMSITVLPNTIYEMNCYDPEINETGIYAATTSTAKINYISRILKGW